MLDAFSLNFEAGTKTTFSYDFLAPCRVQIWKKTFCQKFGYILFKMTYMYMLCIYKKPIILKPI